MVIFITFVSSTLLKILNEFISRNITPNRSSENLIKFPESKRRINFSSKRDFTCNIFRLGVSMASHLAFAAPSALEGVYWRLIFGEKVPKISTDVSPPSTKPKY